MLYGSRLGRTVVPTDCPTFHCQGTEHQPHCPLPHHWTKVDNVSTAADLALMVSAAGGYPLIRQATTTRRQEVRPYSSRGPLAYGNTNRLLKNASWDIGLSKTGYINEAGRCLVMQANIEGEEVSIVLLNSFGKLTPFGDSNRLRKWMLANS